MLGSGQYHLAVAGGTDIGPTEARDYLFGYVQVRLEGETRGLQLRSMAVNVMAPGLSALSKEGRKGRANTGEKWFFDVSNIKR